MSAAIDGLALGLGVAVTPFNLLYCLIGTLLGTLIGMLPGIGPVATIAMLLPLTSYLPPVTALIMLAGIYYGAQYGGSTTAILIRLPGETSAVITCLDGYAMAAQGRAGSALAVAALGSFFAGCVATGVIALFAPALTTMAQHFASAEYFALMVVGLVAAVVLAQGSVLKALAVMVLGLLLGLVGGDVNSGALRFTFGLPQLADGIGFVPLAMGLFGLSEIMLGLEERVGRAQTQPITRLWPTRDDLRRAWPAVCRGTALGSVLGVLPGGGAVLSAFASYMLEKRVSRRPEEFGRGAVEGVAGPESANNAGAQTSFIPMLTLGLPSNPVMALMAGAMMTQGIAPGPQVMTKQPELFWGVIASMWIGNLMLVVINLPLVRLWVTLLKVPRRLLFPGILVFACVGSYSVSNSVFDIYLMGLFGVIGYGLIKFGFEPAPLLLAYVLGPLMEENLRRALLLSRGDPTVFLTRPISLGLLMLALLLLAVAIVPAVARLRREAFAE